MIAVLSLILVLQGSTPTHKIVARLYTCLKQISVHVSAYICHTCPHAHLSTWPHTQMPTPMASPVLPLPLVWMHAHRCRRPCAHTHTRTHAHTQFDQFQRWIRRLSWAGRRHYTALVAGHCRRCHRLLCALGDRHTHACMHAHARMYTLRGNMCLDPCP